MVEAMKTLLLSAFALILIALGTCCVFFPRTVQAFAVKSVDLGMTRNMPNLRVYIASASYLNGVRAIGVVAYLISVFLVVARLAALRR